MENLHIKIEGDSGFRSRMMKIKTPWYKRAYWSISRNLTDIILVACAAAIVWSFV